MARSKYGAIKEVVDGITFDSRAEARRYRELKLLEKAGDVNGLACHLRYPLWVCGECIGTYVADFTYIDGKGNEVIEDVKGVVTPVFRLKAKLVKAIYGKTIVVVRA